MFIKRGIRFFLYKRRAGVGKGLMIHVRVTIKGQMPFYISTGRKVDLVDWDDNAERVKRGAKDADSINQTIGEFRNCLNEVFARYELLEKRVPTPEEVKTLFRDLAGIESIIEQRAITISEAFDEYVNTKGRQNNWTKASYQKHEVIKKHFLSVMKRKPINLITPKTLQEFIDHLHERGLRNTTIQKNYRFLKGFLRWAKTKEYYDGKALEEFKPRLKGTDGNQKEVIYLTLEELQQLKEYQIPEDKTYLSPARDVFLFCCYTSLRYSDVKALRKSDIRGEAIHVVTQKTVDGLTIELNEPAKAILAKYEKDDLEKDAALPVESNKKYNDYLKELCKLAGLDTPTRIVYYKGSKRYDEFHPKYELITSHCARRTFVVTALQLGIPAEVIIRWTGHADYEAMKPYIAIVDNLKKREMSKFNSL